jgi:hypothetical protein
VIALLAFIPVARVVLYASQGSPVVFGGLLVLLVLNRLGGALEPLPALAEGTLGLAFALGLGLALWILRRGGLPGEPRFVRLGARFAALALSLALWRASISSSASSTSCSVLEVHEKVYDVAVSGKRTIDADGRQTGDDPG